jgi:alpha-amylase
MTNVCMYFQVHQPFRLRQFNLFDIGKSTSYFDIDKNKDIMRKVARKCYLPTNKILLDNIHKYGEKFKIAFSITGTALEQFQKYSPEVLESFQKLAATGQVEFLSETYYHSLSYLFDKEEFKHQVRMHTRAMQSLFKAKPTIFRNTELVYNNELAGFVERMGYKGILAEGADHILGWRSPNYVYKPVATTNMKLLLKNYKLSDDIAFRFSNKGWAGYPLTAPKFVDWLKPIRGDTINLFMDYETFGEHHWEETGILQFLKRLPQEMFNRGLGFHHPSEVIQMQTKDTIDIHNYLSWADVERDVSAWLGNRMQYAAAQQLFSLRQQVLDSNDPVLINAWRKMTTSDHFYYMCTKWFNDGDVHKYFNPYDSPYDCFIAFMNVLQDMVLRLKESQKNVLEQTKVRV